MSETKEHVYSEIFWCGIAPDPILSVDEWADRYRVLSSVAAAEPGPWRTERTPYLREIMQCLSAASPVEEVVFMKGAQIGATETGCNWIGYVIDVTSGPMLAVQPTVDLAKRASKQRIDPLIALCDRLKEKVRDPRSRDSGNTVLSKEYPGGILVLTGANSAVGLRSLPARFIFLDEVDAYPGDVDGEGDPVTLAKARSRTFSRRKIFLVSTPTFHGRSRIEAAFEESDRRFYHVPCPLCGHFQVLRWARVEWPKGSPHEAKYRCEGCEKLFGEESKTAMLAAGRWVPENPGARRGKVAGFHLSSLYSPVGWYSWADAAADWERDNKEPERLRGFINTVLGETWKEPGDAPDWKRLYDRRELYPVGEVPAPAVFLTAGADVQKDRIEVEIVGWGRGKESWSVAHRVFAGDTSTEAGPPWVALRALLDEQFKSATGVYLPIRMLAVDSGYNTNVVYTWARGFPMNRVIATKGQENLAVMLGAPSVVDVNVRGQRIRRGFKVWPVGVNHAKTELYGWLRLEKPVEGEPFPPGYCHFPEYGEEFFKQLTAEQLSIRTVRGYSHHVWEKIRERNEILDCRVLARVAAAACGMDRWRAEQWDVNSPLPPSSPPDEKKPHEQSSNLKTPQSSSYRRQTETIPRRKSTFL